MAALELTHGLRDEAFTVTGGRFPGLTLRPFFFNAGAMAWYSAVTPSSLKRAAIVPKTGMASVGCVKSSRLR